MAAPDGFAEGMLPSAVNNSAREVMAQVRRWAEQVVSNFYAADTGIANAYNITPGITPATYTTGAFYLMRAATSNTSLTPTFAVNGMTDTTIQKQGLQLIEDDIGVNDIVALVYDGTNFQLLNPRAPVLPDGAVTSPSLAFASDPDTGFYRAGAGSIGGAADGVQWLNVTSAGEVTLPKQPSFFANVGSTISDVTGNGTAYVVVFDTEVFDQNADFNNATGIFTAPVTGRYQFNTNVRTTQLGTATQVNIEIVASNRTILQVDAFVASTFTTKGSTLSTLVDMDAADTAKVQITVIGTGADTADVVAAGLGATFSGFLAN